MRNGSSRAWRGLARAGVRWGKDRAGAAAAWIHDLARPLGIAALVIAGCATSATVVAHPAITSAAIPSGRGMDP